jgi:predicted  nucleic acid-binding Zn-ribbon protein
MGYKKVCFNCRKAFSLGTDISVNHSSTCPECGKETFRLNHSFRPPSKDDLKKWEVVEFLKNHGFIYQHIYSEWTAKVYEGLVNYPETMTEAKEFVVKYSSQAYDTAK